MPGNQGKPTTGGDPPQNGAGGVHAKELARKHAPEAIERLAQIVATGDSHSAVVAAANAILDRAYGRAPTFNTSDPNTFKRAIDMSDDELAAIAARAGLHVVK